MAENSLSSLFSSPTPDVSPEPRTDLAQEPWALDENFNHSYVQEPIVLLPLTNASHRPTSTLKLEYAASLPEYPETDPHGFTYVVYVGGHDPDSVSKLMHEIQYHKKIISPAKPVYCPFLDTKVLKHRFRCSGIKTCDRFSEDLKAVRHTRVGDDLQKYLKRSQQAADLCQTNPSRANAYSFFKSLVLQFQNGYACPRPRLDCRPQIHRPDTTAPGQTDPVIRCANFDGDPEGHYWKPVREVPNFDFKIACEVFGPDEAPYLDRCDMVYSTSTRLTSCKIPHLPGAGKLLEQPCDVIFQVMIPYDLKARPYILFLSHGIHKHVPPMPVRAPQMLTERTILLLAKSKSSDNTLPMFLKPPAIEALCAAEFSGLSIPEIRKRITTGDFLTAAVERQRLLRYLGTNYYLTTLLELDRDDTMRDYIQEVYQDKEGLMIICALKQQLEMLLSVKTFEVHLKPSLLRHGTLYEMVFMACQEANGSGEMALPLVRVFTDQKSPHSFCRLFHRVFELARLMTGDQKSAFFHHIHRSGYRSVLIDMEQILYTGFGQYLSEIDPARRDPTWHLRNITMFCRPHFLNKVSELVGPRVQNVVLWDQMARLIDCSSKQEYEQISELLIGCDNEKVANWAQNTKDPVICAGLNMHFSSLPSGIYTSFRRRRTAAEETHTSEHAQHIRSLLPTIRWSWNNDKAIMARWDSRMKAGRPAASEPAIFTFAGSAPPAPGRPQRTTIPTPAVTQQSMALPRRVTSEVRSKRKHSEVEPSSPSIQINEGPINIPDDTPVHEMPGNVPGRTSSSRSDALVRSWLASTDPPDEDRREKEKIRLLLMDLQIQKKKNAIVDHELQAQRIRIELELDEFKLKLAKEESEFFRDTPWEELMEM